MDTKQPEHSQVTTSLARARRYVYTRTVRINTLRIPQTLDRDGKNFYPHALMKRAMDKIELAEKELALGKEPKEIQRIYGHARSIAALVIGFLKTKGYDV